jgi:hypothetical protein
VKTEKKQSSRVTNVGRSAYRPRRRNAMNMQVKNGDLPSSASDPVIAALEQYRLAALAFSQFLREKDIFDESRRNAEGKFTPHPDEDVFDQREEQVCSAERRAAEELAQAVPTSPESVFSKLDYIVSENDRGNRIYSDLELIEVLRSILLSGLLSGSKGLQSRRAADSYAGCPVYHLAREHDRLAKKYHQLDEEASKSQGEIDNSRAMMMIWDRMNSIYDEASYLKPKSTAGTAFQMLIVKSHLDVLTDLKGNDHRELQTRLDRLLFRSIQKLLPAREIPDSQAQLLDEHLSPFSLLESISGH